jgi:FKBP-type peptidyl-prolyl cis-trans isomerase
MAQFEKDMEQKQKQLGEKNKTEGAKYLEDNKKKPGVKTTASGLQYKVEKEGTGAQPKATDMVTVNYRGTLIDGTEFDSSYKRGQPATFPVNGVIKGWTEALQLMKQGSKYQLFIPSNLAYGERAMGPDIGPNSTLIFEVELQEVKPPPTPAQGSAKTGASPGASVKMPPPSPAPTKK